MASIRVLYNPAIRLSIGQLVRKNVISCCHKNFSSNYIRARTPLKSLKSELTVTQKNLLHTSSPRHNPIVAIIVRNVAKFAAVVTGRYALRRDGHFMSNRDYSEQSANGGEDYRQTNERSSGIGSPDISGSSLWSWLPLSPVLLSTTTAIYRRLRSPKENDS